MSNFNSYLAILSAVDSAPVRRLEWQKQNLEVSQLFTQETVFANHALLSGKICEMYLHDSVLAIVSAKIEVMKHRFISDNGPSSVCNAYI